jgi:hypothetical protein
VRLRGSSVKDAALGSERRDIRDRTQPPCDTQANAFKAYAEKSRRGERRRKMRKTSVLAVIACLATILPASAAQAQSQPQDPYVCTADASTHPPGATFDNVVVPPGTLCQLHGVTVRGNVKALENSILGIGFSNIGGNVEGDKADEVQVRDSTVRGNITIVEGGPAPFFFHEVDLSNVILPNGQVHIEKMTGSITVGRFVGNMIKGNVKAEDNTIPPGEIFDIANNAIGGNLQVFKNKGLANKEVQFNTVAGVIQCWENEPPFVGGPNTGRADPFMGPPFFGPNQCLGTPAT